MNNEIRQIEISLLYCLSIIIINYFRQLDNIRAKSFCNKKKLFCNANSAYIYIYIYIQESLNK